MKNLGFAEISQSGLIWFKVVSSLEIWFNHLKFGLIIRKSGLIALFLV